MSEKSGSSINYETLETFRKISSLIEKHRKENDEWPKYLFLSNEAYHLLAVGDFTLKIGEHLTAFMGIEIKGVDVPGIYAALGGEF